MRFRTSALFATFAVAVTILGAVVAGCGGEATTTTLVAAPTTMLVVGETTATTAPAAPETTTTAAPETTTSATEVIVVSTESTETTKTTKTTEPAVPQVSAAAKAYAKGLGGASYLGEGLYLIIGASKKTEAECQALLDAAIPSFGDMQDYFIIQRSDNFSGLQPGYFILMEAHLNKPLPDSMDFARRGFPDAYVKFVTVNTADPIPTYEDAMGSAEGD